jgi:cell division protease FtsH
MKYLLGLFLFSFSLFPNSEALLKNVSCRLLSSKKTDTTLCLSRRESYPFSQQYYENYVRRLNSKNVTIQLNSILDIDESFLNQNFVEDQNNYSVSPYWKHQKKGPGLGISQNYNYRKSQRRQMNPDQLKMLIDKASHLYNQITSNVEKQADSHLYMENESSETGETGKNNGKEDEKEDGNEEEEVPINYQNPYQRHLFSYTNSNSGEETKSTHFEVIKNYKVKFEDIGGYQNIKNELEQCIDLLKNYPKYAKYNVRIPKGLIFEGPPGNGKTLLAKGLAGEAGCGFISVSGSDFQEKYVGVGPTRIKELFKLAKKNVPCIIFIDEIDALGRKRSSDGESSSNERDNTLNALLVEMDGFKNNTGIFIVGATNRVDLLDSALMRPGRMDKKIYIGFPDKVTREAIINIHIHGKPYDKTIILKDLVEITEGYSGAQIENLLNEAMLNALRVNRTEFTYADFDVVLNKMMAGWQPSEHQFTADIIDHIAIHEMGHAVVGLLSKHHSKMSKVIINLSSPKMPGYTVFESSISSIYKREALFEHLMILLAGRIAEEVFYDVSVTTGALNDFEEALKLAEKMVVYYGMGKQVIYPHLSEKYKELIDDDVVQLIDDAYKYAGIILTQSKDLIQESAEILKREKLLKAEALLQLIKEKYPELLDLK